MSSLDELSRKELQALAKKYKIKANSTNQRMREELSAIMSSAEEKVSEEKSPVHWFIDGDLPFSLGIELYEGGFPIVSGDDVRTYMKVYIRGLPHKGLESTDIICQLFYLSSGANSAMGGVWLPTDLMSLRFDDSSGERLWKWYVQKKPWFIGKTSADGQDPAFRFGGDPTVAMISLMLGGIRMSGDDGSSIDRIYSYVEANLENYLVSTWGKDIGERNSKILEEYYSRMSSNINLYLRSKLSVPRPKCDEYDLDMWIDKCNSYNWFAPFDDRYPKFIPNLDPSSEDSLWDELPEGYPGEGKMFISDMWLNSRKATMDYLSAKKEKEEGFPSAKTAIDTARAVGQFRVKENIHYALIKRAKVPKNLATRDDLLARKQD